MIVASPPARQHRYTLIVVYSSENDTYLTKVPSLGFMTFGFSIDHVYEVIGDAAKL